MNSEANGVIRKVAGLEGRLSDTERCPECNSASSTMDGQRAEVVCNGCGIVLQENMIDHGPPHREFSADPKEQKSHHGPAETITRHDKGLPTVISFRDRDAYGKAIPSSRRWDFYRLRKQQLRASVIDKERGLSAGLILLQDYCDRGGLPKSVHEDAALIYRRLHTKARMSGRSKEAIIAACIYGACRQQGMPRSLDDISSIASVGRRELGRSYRYLSRVLRLKLLPTAPEDYVPRLCSELKLSPAAQKRTLEVIISARQENAINTGPLGIAAAAIYMASVLCGERRTQREIADKAGVTEVTLRNRYRVIASALRISGKHSYGVPMWTEIIHKQ